MSLRPLPPLRAGRKLGTLVDPAGRVVARIEPGDADPRGLAEEIALRISSHEALVHAIAMSGIERRRLEAEVAELKASIDAARFLARILEPET